MDTVTFSLQAESAVVIVYLVCECSMEPLLLAPRDLFDYF